MTTRIHLVRHGHHPLLGRVLCGRMAGVGLDAQGALEMEATAELLKATASNVLQSSPQRRTLQSAAIISAALGLPVEVVPAFDEIDMGRWTGMEFSQLSDDSHWRQWNERRGSTSPPSGESMVALQKRVVDYLEQLRNVGGSIIVVSHAEPIRAALLHFLAIPLVRFHSIDVEPASISTITFERGQATVSSLQHEASA